MKHDKMLTDENGRIAALQRYNILDTAAEAPFDKLTELVRNVLGVPIAAVSLIDSHRQWFKSIAGVDAREGPRDISFCGYAIQRREPMMVTDATLDPRFSDNPLVTGGPMVRSYLGIPLETPDGYNLGTLCAIDTKPRVFTAHEITILTSFAKLVLNELELRQIAMSDVLTGALSRRGLIAAAETEMARSRRYGTDAALVLFDVDNFKQINDQHGHAVGDVVLKNLVRRCFETLRSGDVLGRIGGEEFAILLPATGASGALDLAERLRRRFAALPVEVNGLDLRVTASFGVCGLGSGIAGVDAWLALADDYLYEAKAGGRNCCRGNAAPERGALS